MNDSSAHAPTVQVAAIKAAVEIASWSKSESSENNLKNVIDACDALMKAVTERVTVNVNIAGKE